MLVPVARRCFNHVSNVIEANLLAAPVPGVVGEVFNVACGERLGYAPTVGFLEGLPGAVAGGSI